MLFRVLTSSWSLRLLSFISLLLVHALLTGAFVAAFPLPPQALPAKQPGQPRARDIQVCYGKVSEDGSLERWRTVKVGELKKDVQFICFVTHNKCLGWHPPTEKVLDFEYDQTLNSNYRRTLGHTIPYEFNNWSTPENVPANTTLFEFLSNLEYLQKANNEEVVKLVDSRAYIASVRTYLLSKKMAETSQYGGSSKAHFILGQYGRLHSKKSEGFGFNLCKGGAEPNAVCIMRLDLCVAWHDGEAVILNKKIHRSAKTVSKIDTRYHWPLMDVTFAVGSQNTPDQTQALEGEDSEITQVKRVFETCLNTKGLKHQATDFESALRGMMSCLVEKNLAKGYESYLPLRKPNGSVTASDTENTLEPPPNKKVRPNPQPPKGSGAATTSTNSTVSSKLRTPLPPWPILNHGSTDNLPDPSDV
ncbi:hypothetical protein J3R30DRAFT_3400482 [Lentinula aciculospora]|uniref:Uncharacterized protein n=1 Tax=Lentinula aciculospora TaxID=153920 RepID=A0A9W9APX7_9AGAR|nr:hypothetical protein J3R30DRAFT_3400482 [Lentinula aciculospora]